jgi:hypothetical protein
LYSWALGGDQHEHRGTIRRFDGYPAAAGSKPGIERQIESKLIHIELETAILIVDIDVDGVDSEVGLRRGRVCHRCDYMPVAAPARYIRRVEG